MRIVVLSTSDISGGAAIASGRMAVALRKQGHEVHQLVLFKRSNEAAVEVIAGDSWVSERLRDAQYFFTQQFLVKPGYQLSFDPWLGHDVSRHPLVKNADVIQLHWINHGFMGMRELKALFALQKPVFWHMHDYWAFTGGCHYPGNCRNFESGCGNCPALKTAGLNDATARQFRLKKQLFQLNRPTLVGASGWLAEEAKKAALANDADVAHVPNPIDSGFYGLKGTIDYRKLLNIGADEKVVLFAAMNAGDVRKGFRELVESLHHFKQISSTPIRLLVAGKASFSTAMPFETSFLGTLNAVQMRSAYQAADVFVIPSLEENLPNTILEAMASGTPVVGFETGGIPEMVLNGVSGYTAKTGDAIGLGEALYKALNHSEAYDFEAVLSAYSEKVVGSTYAMLMSKKCKG